MASKLSIITPTYNRASVLERCIKSVLIQRFDDYEHVIIDDGSTDDTATVINEYKEVSNKIVSVKYKDNRGVNYARNRGIEAGTGKFLLFLDSDDQLLPGALKTLSDFVRHYESYTHFLFQVPGKLDSSTEARSVYFKDWVSGKFGGDYTLVIKKDYLIKMPFLEQFRAFEGISLLRICRVSEPQIFIPTVLVDIERERSDSLTRVIHNKNSLYYQEIFKKNLYYLNEYLDDHLSYGDLDKLNKMIIKTYLYSHITSNAKEMLEIDDLLARKDIRKWYYPLLKMRVMKCLTTFLVKYGLV